MCGLYCAKHHSYENWISVLIKSLTIRRKSLSLILYSDQSWDITDQVVSMVLALQFSIGLYLRLCNKLNVEERLDEDIQAESTFLRHVFEVDSELARTDKIREGFLKNDRHLLYL